MQAVGLCGCRRLQAVGLCGCRRLQAVGLCGCRRLQAVGLCAEVGALDGLCAEDGALESGVGETVAKRVERREGTREGGRRVEAV